MAEQNLERTSLARRTWPFLIAGLGTLVLLIFLAGLVLWQHAQRIQEQAMETQHRFVQIDHALERLRLETLSTAIDVRDFLIEDSPELNRQQKLKVEKHKAALFQAIEEVQHLPANRPASAASLKNQVASFWIRVEDAMTWPVEERKRRWLDSMNVSVTGRQAVLNQAELVGAQNAEYLQERDTALRNSFNELKDYMVRGIIWVLLLALGISALTVWKVTALENSAQRNKQELERLSRELRHLSQALVQVQEEERKSLSRELHDEVGQMITVLRMELGTAEQRASATDSAALPHLRAASAVADQTLRSIRSLARGLRPSMLDELGVVPALNWLAREFTKHGTINVSVATEGEMDQVPESYRTCIYRVAQEALTNCARHARAQEVLLELKRTADSLTLNIQDDGKGFDLSQTSNGIGLVGMKERVRELNGNLTIETGPQKGTRLKVQIPLWEEIAA